MSDLVSVSVDSSCTHTHGIICCKHPVVSHKPQVISLFGRGTSNSAHFTSSSSRSHSSTQHTEPVIACSLNHNFVASSANSLTYCYRHFRAKSLLCYCCSLKWTFFFFHITHEFSLLLNGASDKVWNWHFLLTFLKRKKKKTCDNYSDSFFQGPDLGSQNQTMQYWCGFYVIFLTPFLTKVSVYCVTFYSESNGYKKRSQRVSFSYSHNSETLATAPPP